MRQRLLEPGYRLAHSPHSAAVLRVPLFANTTVRLLVDGLMSVGGAASSVELAERCDPLCHARAPVLFLTPDALGDLQDEHGAVAWRMAGGSAFHPTVSYQLTSVPKHAGILSADVRQY
jgi:hypothetical protein